MVRIWNGILNPEAQPFEIRTNSRHFVKNHLKSGYKPLDFEWLGFQMVGTIATAKAKARPFEIRPSKSPNFKWSDFRSQLYLDPECTYLVLLARLALTRSIC